MVLLTDSEPNLTIGEPNREIRSQIIQVERERERERERPARVVQPMGHERGRMAQPLDRSRTMNKHGLPTQWWLMLTAEENFNYWISNC